jgi:hypothetical protein
MQLHQHAAGCLPQGIERKQSPRRRFGALVLSGLHRPGEQCRQSSLGEPAQPLPLHQQPVLEGLVANADAVEQIAAVERDRLLDALRRARA